MNEERPAAIPLSNLDLPGLLTLALVGALWELLADRLLGGFGIYQNAMPGSALDLLGRSGMFGMYLAGLLGILLAAHGLLMLLANRRTAPRSRRLVIFVFASVFLPTSATSLFVRPTAGASLFGYVTAVLTAGFLATLSFHHRVKASTRVAGFALFVPYFLVCYFLSSQIYPAFRLPGSLAFLPKLLGQTGEWLFLFAPLAVFFMVRPRPLFRGSAVSLWPGGLFGILSGGVVLVIALTAKELFPLLAYRTLGLFLNSVSAVPSFVYVAAAALWGAASGMCLFPPRDALDRKSIQRAGFGIAFIGLAGIEPVSPWLFLMYGLGNILVCRGIVGPSLDAALMGEDIPIRTDMWASPSRPLG